MRLDTGSAWQSEINVTPLVDVVLVLLIIFMVVVPLTLRGYDVDVPGPAVSIEDADRAGHQVVLEIDARDCPALQPPSGGEPPRDCRVRVGETRVGVDELAAHVSEVFSGRTGPDRVLFLSADDRLNYESVMRIVDAATSSTVDLRIGIVTRPERDGSAYGDAPRSRS